MVASYPREGVLGPHPVAVPTQEPHEKHAPRVLEERPECLPNHRAVRALVGMAHGGMGELAAASAETEVAVAVVARRGPDHVVLGEGARLGAALHSLYRKKNLKKVCCVG